MLQARSSVARLASCMVGSTILVIRDQKVCPSDCSGWPVGQAVGILSLLLHVDNLAMVSILNKRYAKDPFLSHLLQCLFIFSTFLKFHFPAEHIPGLSNTAVDAFTFFFVGQQPTIPTPELVTISFRSSYYSKHLT